MSNIYDELQQIQRVYRNKKEPSILLFQVSVENLADRKFYPFVKPPMMPFEDFFESTFLMAPMDWKKLYHNFPAQNKDILELDWNDVTDEVREFVHEVVLVQ